MRMLTKVISVATIFAWVGSNAMAVDATVIGRAMADRNGSGVITAAVDPSLDGPSVVDKVTEQVQMTNSARPRIVSVDQGVLSIEFEAAAPSQEVEALLPVELANSLAGSGPIAVDTLTPAIIGGGAVLVTGGVLGGLAAAGKFDGSKTFSPTR